MIFPRKQLESDLICKALSGTIVAQTSGSMQAHSFSRWIRHSISIVKRTADDPIVSVPDGHNCRTRNIDIVADGSQHSSVMVCCHHNGHKTRSHMIWLSCNLWKLSASQNKHVAEGSPGTCYHALVAEALVEKRWRDVPPKYLDNKIDSSFRAIIQATTVGSQQTATVSPFLQRAVRIDISIPTVRCKTGISIPTVRCKTGISISTVRCTNRHLHSNCAPNDPISIPTVRQMTLSPFQLCAKWPYLHSNCALNNPISIPTVRQMTLSPFQLCTKWPYLHSNCALNDPISIPTVQQMTLSPFQPCAEWPYLHSNCALNVPISIPTVRWMTLSHSISKLNDPISIPTVH